MKPKVTESVEKKLTTSKIMPCSCAHAMQDSMYGKNQRVFNFQNGNDGKGKGWKCTVCRANKA